jgi:hypothetical protein
MIQPVFSRALGILLRPDVCIPLLALVASGPLAISQAAGSPAPGDNPEAKKAYYLVVFNNPYAGKDAEFNKYYDENHVPEMLQTPNVVSSQRFVAADVDKLPKQEAPRKYMVMYRIETDDIAATYNSFGPRPAQGAKSAPGAGQGAPPAGQGAPNAGQGGAGAAGQRAPGAMASSPVDNTTTFSITYEVLGPEIKGAGPKNTGKGEMKTYYFCARNSPLPGKDKEFNEWYSKQHGPEVAATPGIVSAQRYHRSAVQRDNAGQSPEYLIMYKIVTDDLGSIFDDIDKRAKNFPTDTTHDASKSEHFTYQALGPVITAESLKATAAKK